MSDVLFLQKQLMETQKSLAEAEALVVRFPESRSMVLNANSLRTQMQVLEREFSAAANDEGYALCDYRVLTPRRPASSSFAAAADAIKAFQEMLSLVYASIKSGSPRMRAGAVTSEVQNATSLGFGYAYAGSIGIVLTVPKDAGLLDHAMEESFEVIERMTRAERVEDLSDDIGRLGPAAVTALFHWANAHARGGTGASIDFREADVTRNHIVAERPRLQRLAGVIAELSAESVNYIERVGTIVGIDSAHRSFHATFPEAPEIRFGTLAPGIGDDAEPVAVPKRYRMYLERRGQLVFATGTEKVSWTLLEIHPATADRGLPTDVLPDDDDTSG